MSTPTERELRRELDDLQAGESLDPEDIRLEWRDAAPKARPDGMEWRPPTDADPGLLAYDVWEAQRDCLDAVTSGEYDLVSFLAGFGAGKSQLGARFILATALEYPGTRHLVMGQSFAEARDTTYTKFFEALPGGDRTAHRTSGLNGPETSPLVTDYNRTERRLTLANGSVVILGSADKYSRHAGSEFSSIWCDEVAHYGNLHDLLDMLTSRLRGTEGPKVQLWTTTPAGYNDLWEIVDQQEAPEGEALGLDIAVTRASVLDNPYLTEDDKALFRRQFEGTAKENQALHGGFAEASGKLLDRGNLTFLSSDEVADAPGETYQVHLGVDLGFVGSHAHAVAHDTDYTAVICGFVPQDTSGPRRVYLTDCDRKRGMDIDETLAWLRQIGQGLAESGYRPVWKIEDVAGSKHTVQRARKVLPGKVVPVTPDGSKADRLMDMETLFSSRQVVLVNDEDHDGPREYSDVWRPFVDEWTQYGTDDAHDDLLDATYYCLDGIRLGAGVGAIGSFDPWENTG